MKTLLISILLATQCLIASAQNQDGYDERNPATWAKSMVGKKISPIKVDKWVNRAPEDYKGKFLMIHFWNPTYAWGAYISIPRFNRLYKELNKDLMFIGITSALPEHVNDIVPMIKYPYASSPQMIDEYEVREYCYVYLVNPDGVVCWQGCPYMEGYDLTDKQLKKFISDYKKKKK